MSKVINASDCWNRAFVLDANGQKGGAIEICQGPLCAGVLECQLYLGWTYYQQGDLTSANQWFSRAIETGNANALYGIASIRYIEKKYSESLEYFNDAAEKGCARAFHWIGYFYQKSLGVPVDFYKAAHFYKKGADNGFLIAQHALIRLAFQTPGVINKIRIFPKFIYLILKTAVVSRDANDPRFSDFLLLGPSINNKQAESKGSPVEVQI